MDKARQLPRQSFSIRPRMPSERQWQKARAFMLKERKRAAFERDEAICQHCAEKGYKYAPQLVDGHHLIPRERAPHLVLDPENVIFLCKYHHAKAEQLGIIGA